MFPLTTATETPIKRGRITELTDILHLHLEESTSSGATNGRIIYFSLVGSVNSSRRRESSGHKVEFMGDTRWNSSAGRRRSSPRPASSSNSTTNEEGLPVGPLLRHEEHSRLGAFCTVMRLLDARTHLLRITAYLQWQTASKFVDVVGEVQ